MLCYAHDPSPPASLVDGIEGEAGEGVLPVDDVEDVGVGVELTQGPGHHQQIDTFLICC